MAPDFLYAVVQLGAERAIKDELARRAPGLRPAFQRPGFVTFKSERPLAPDFVLPSVLARAYARSVGRGTSLAELCALRDGLALARPPRLHVFPRDTVVPGEYDETQRAPGLDAADALRDALLAQGGFEAGPSALGDDVLSVVLAEGEPSYVGHHVHHAGHSVHPGGRLDQRLPPDAPSRAWLKAADLFDLGGLTMEPGTVVCEIGCAPGGAVAAMLAAGMEVYGVDPGAMDPRLLPEGSRDHGGFHHLAMPVGAVTDRHLPKALHVLMLDVNLAPQVAFRSALRLAAMRRDSLRALLFTLKMNEWSYLENLPAFEARAAELGFTDIRIRQLASHRREVGFAARKPALPLAAPVDRR